MANRIQLRRDTQANWERVNPILEDGEPGLDITQNKIKYGDGTTQWNSLPYASGGTSGNVSTGNTLVNGSYTVSLGADGTVTFPSGNLSIGTIYGSDAMFGSANAIVGVLGQGISGAVALEWTKDGITSGTGNVAGVILNGPFVPEGVQITTGPIGMGGGSYNWAFSTDGNVTLPSGVKLTPGYPGYGYIANTAALAGDQVYLSSTDGLAWVGVENGTPKIGTSSGIWLFGTDGTLTTPGNVIIGTGPDLGWGNISMVDTISANNFVYANGVSILSGLGGGATGNVANLVNGSETVSLSADGKLTFPNGNFFQSQSGQGETNLQIIDNTNAFKIYTHASSGYQAWVFAADGSTTFPDHGNVSMTGTLTVGNLVVNGNSVIINTQSYSVEDNIIQIAAGNPADTLDIGFVGHRTVNSILQHTGLVRNAGLNQWALFSNVVAQPGTTVDFTDAIYDDLRLGNITSPTITGINSNILAINASIAFANTIQSQQIAAANVGMIGYIDQGNTIQAAAITAANIGMLGYVNSQTFYSNARVATYLQVGNISNVSVAGNVTATYFVGNGAFLTGIAASSNYGNVQVAQYLQVGNIANISVAGNVTATYFVGNGAFLTGIVASGSYSNVQVATYLPTYTGNIANVRLGVSGVLTFPDGTTQTTAAAAGGGSSYGNANVAQYLPTHTGNVGVNSLIGTTPNVTLVSGSYSTTYDIYGNVAFGNAAYPVQISAAGNISTGGYLFGNGAFLTGIVTSAGGGGSSYGNANVAQYLQVGNIANISVAGNVTATYFVGNGALLTGIAASSNYSNVQVATYLPTYTGNIGSNIGIAGALTVFSANSAPFTTNDAVYVYGGLTTLANISSGGRLVACSFATSTNINSGAIQTNGGIGAWGNVYVGQNVVATGNVSATYLIGTQVGNSIGTTATYTSNVSAGNVSATGNVTVSGYVVTAGGYGNISQVDYITANNVVATANVTVQGIGVTMPNRPAFRVNGTGLTAQTTSNVNLKGAAISTAYNQGSYFDATTGKFTAPIAGIYEVLLNARVNSSFNGLAQLVVLKNGLNTAGNVIAFWETSSNIGGATHFGVSGTVQLASGDYLSANILVGSVTFDANDNWSVTYLG